MSTSTYIHFFRDPSDPRHQKYVTALLALVDADVTKLPDELAEYFGEEYAEPYLVDGSLDVGYFNISYPEIPEEISPAVSRVDDGYEIDLGKLPEDVRRIRVVVS